MIYINDEIDQLNTDEVLTQLSEQRREQVLKMKHQPGRQQSAAAYLLLREALLQEYGISEAPQFSYGEHGKPMLADHPGLHFNLSHCKGTALCALSPHPIGVDIESIREFRDSLAEYTMNEQELLQIRQSARPDVAFIRLWTMKESLLKLSGEGIRTSMKDVLSKAEGMVQFSTVVNLQKNYIYSICEHCQTD